MGRPLTGIHVFEKRGPIEWEGIIAAIQLLSAISWKRYHGNIELYTNSAWLEVLKRYKIDQVYSTIHEIPEQNKLIDRNLFWSWPKLQVARKMTPEHVMLDTDLWITASLEIDPAQDFMAFHNETWSAADPATAYPDFDIMLKPDLVGRWDKSVRPVNCALLWFHNMELLNRWLDLAEEIAVSPESRRLSDESRVVHAVFIEQRLLAMVAREMGLSNSTFLGLTYLTHVTDTGNGECWFPAPADWPNSRRLQIEAFKHIWGCKRLWTYDAVLRNHQFRVIASELHRFSGEYEIEPALADVLSAIN